MTPVSTDQLVNPDQLAEPILNGGEITEAEALALLSTPDEDVFGLVHAGSRLRREHFGMTIKLNYLVNLKSGMCPEIELAKTAGLSPCSGLIVGLGESDEQIIEALFALKALGSDSIPINFLVLFDGTPLEGQWNLTPMQCMKIVATARFVCPDREIRLAGGRETHLRLLQPMALQLANSIFLGDYLTAEAATHTDPVIRRRGAGTAEVANA